MATVTETRPASKPTRTPPTVAEIIERTPIVPAPVDPWYEDRPPRPSPPAWLVFGVRVRHNLIPGTWKVVREPARYGNGSDWLVRVREQAADGSLFGPVLSWKVGEVAAVVTDASVPEVAAPVAVQAEATAAPADEPRPLVVAMVISIDGTHYAVAPLAPSPDAVKAFRLAKVGGDERVYDVEELVGGARCDCADFVFRREGLDGLGCKHTRASWMMGLIGEYGPAPASPDPRDPYAGHRAKLAALEASEAVVRLEGEPVACCDDATPMPCTACVHADEPTAADWDDFGAWASEVDRRAWDARIDDDDDGDDDASEGWSDDDVITLGPAADPLADDRPDRRTLAEQVDVEAAHYRGLATPFGDLIARTLETLSARVRFLGASDVATYEDRLTAMLDQVRVEAEARQAAGVCG